MKRPLRRVIQAAVGAAVLMTGPGSFGVETLAIKHDSYQEFVKGELKTTSLSSDGKVFIAPRKLPVYETGDEIIWDLKEGKDGKIYAATGHNGKIYEFDLHGKGEVLCDLDELEVCALAIDSEGAVYAGASPGGKVYKIIEKDKWMRFYSSGEDYIWEMFFDRKGNLFLATGTKGKIIRVNRKGEGETIYDSEAKNVLTMVERSNGNLLCGTQDKGYVFELDGSHKPFILYEAEGEEVRKVVTDEKGTLYAAVNSEGAGNLLQLNAGTPSSQDIAKALAAKAMAGAGRKKPTSEIIKITPEGYVQRLWLCPETPIHTMRYEAGTDSLMVSAGDKGTLFRVKQNGDYVLLFSLDEKFIMDSLATSNTLLLSTGSSGNVYRLAGAEEEGEYVSEVIDAKNPVQWGNMRFKGEMRNGVSVAVATRSGNTSKPDNTWSAWSGEKKVKEEAIRIESPTARFLQYKLLMKGKSTGALTPLIEYIRVFYLPQNLAPEIKKISFVKLPSYPGKPPVPGAKPPSSAELAKILGAVKEARQTGNRGPGETVGKTADSNSKKKTLIWEASDPNGDRLIADLYFKGEGETTWKEIEKDINLNRFFFDTAAIPDGFYRFKVVVSDRLANPPSIARTTELVSELQEIDNTPPEITVLKGKFEKENRFRIRASSHDGLSIVSSAKFNVDAKEWQPIFPKDQIYDSEEEEFEFYVDTGEGAEHTLSFQATDSEGNSSSKKIVLLKP